MEISEMWSLIMVHFLQGLHCSRLGNVMATVGFLLGKWPEFPMLQNHFDYKIHVQVNWNQGHNVFRLCFVLFVFVQENKSSALQRVKSEDRLSEGSRVSTAHAIFLNSKAEQDWHEVSWENLVTRILFCFPLLSVFFFLSFIPFCWYQGFCPKGLKS